MKYAKLVRPCRPTFYIATMVDDQFYNLYLELNRLYPENEIWMIRGKKCSTLEGFFNEIGAILQVPYYFGENWNALNDMLFERSWLAGSLLMVTDAPLLLANAPGGNFDFLTELMDKCNQKHLIPEEEIGDDDDFGFHILFQCNHENMAAFSERLAAAGAEFAKL